MSDLPPAPQTKKKWYSRTVLALSATSLFSDISHEMGTAVLPLLLASLAGGAAALGLIEGVAQLLMSLGKLYGGSVGDRLSHRKWLTGGGYLVTTLGVGSYVIAGAWWHVLVGRAIAWFGRGFRGPLRDSLMADAADSGDYGKVFGLERASDAAGAVLGPLLSAWLLWLLLPLRLILALAIIPGLLAVLSVWTLVREQPRAPQEAAQRRMFTRLREMPRPFKRFLVAILVFSLGDYSNTLLILWAAGSSWQQGLGTHNLAPILLYAGYNAVSALVSFVSGSLSDTLGRRWLLVSGYTCAVVAAFLVATGSLSLGLMIAAFALSGIAMGNQEAVEKAFAADFLRPYERSLGFGTLALVNGVGKLIASSVVGTLWATYGIAVAFAAAGTVSLLGVVLLVILTAQPAAPTEAQRPAPVD